jgi:ANTAR domain
MLLRSPAEDPTRSRASPADPAASGRSRTRSVPEFAEYHALEGAFGRRAITERVKGILMERHSLDEQQAFQLLREHARRTNRKVVDVARSILDSHQLLSKTEAPVVVDEEILARTEDDG